MLLTIGSSSCTGDFFPRTSVSTNAVSAAFDDVRTVQQRPKSGLGRVIYWCPHDVASTEALNQTRFCLIRSSSMPSRYTGAKEARGRAFCTQGHVAPPRCRPPGESRGETPIVPVPNLLCILAETWPSAQGTAVSIWRAVDVPNDKKFAHPLRNFPWWALFVSRSRLQLCFRKPYPMIYGASYTTLPYYRGRVQQVLFLCWAKCVTVTVSGGYTLVEGWLTLYSNTFQVVSKLPRPGSDFAARGYGKQPALLQHYINTPRRTRHREEFTVRFRTLPLPLDLLLADLIHRGGQPKCSTCVYWKLSAPSQSALTRLPNASRGVVSYGAAPVGYSTVFCFSWGYFAPRPRGK